MFLMHTSLKIFLCTIYNLCGFIHFNCNYHVCLQADYEKFNEMTQRLRQQTKNKEIKVFILFLY